MFCRQLILLAQKADDVARAVIDHLQAHRFSVLALRQDPGQHIPEAFHLFVIDEQVAVHGDAELMATLDFQAREKIVEVIVDDRG